MWWVLSGAGCTTRCRASRCRPALPFLGTLASWLVIVGLLGYGKRYLDRTSPALAYLAEASYPVYILHQTVIVVAAFFVVGLAAAEPLQWLTLLVVSVAVHLCALRAGAALRAHTVPVRHAAAPETRREGGRPCKDAGAITDGAVVGGRQGLRAGPTARRSGVDGRGGGELCSPPPRGSARPRPAAALAPAPRRRPPPARGRKGRNRFRVSAR